MATAQAFRVLAVACIACGLAACGAWENIPPPTPNAADAFEIPDRSAKISTQEAIDAFRIEATTDYRLGNGDQITLNVIGRPEMSGQHILGPDGRITLPLAGPLKLSDLTREEASQAVAKALSPFYKDMYATVKVDKYASNRVTVLGRVEHPGVLQFETAPNLLDILAQAGGLPVLRKEQVLTRCSIVRGDKIIWIDLKRLLTGDLSLNIPLQRNDVVYIPDAFDTSVFILGAVGQPGAYRLTPQMSFLDALGQAGGATLDADTRQMRLIRPGKNQNLEVDMDELLKPNPGLNVVMEEGDIVFVPRNGIAKVGYILQKINPFAQIFTVRQLAGVP